MYIHYITDCSKTGEFHFEGPDAERAGYAGLVPLKSVFFLLTYTTCHKRDNTYSELSEAVLNSVWDGVNLS